ncbi:uncharacterized protein Tco025E_02918 [Trypanosoma conorhini]|uniref:GH29D-like beta-sandwich domain-containing protein n=1 Tax=Trypanosoma conorhini TaxID=83891 RepID=A0A3R7L853_9TRYP|nr:uncharacterized protein Tco025E_02918 [Trypanosoma conorhini]RNF23007.1 hypothetical protein Tco025E_02918 [Trypanosoma conorhini]
MTRAVVSHIPVAGMPQLQLQLLLLLLCGCAAPRAAAVEVLAPAISPPSGCYEGEVGVTVTRRQPDADTYYTLDGSAPTRRSRRFVDGAELLLNSTGHYVVRAVAYAAPTVTGAAFTASPVVLAEYNVTSPSLAPPVATPPTVGQLQRGPLAVTLALAENTTSRANLNIQLLVTHLPSLSTAVAFDALPSAPPDGKWRLHDGKAILLDRPGTYILRARTQDASVSPSKYSRHAIFLYRLQPPLMYDVSTECCDDPRRPVVGHVFTVWLSSALWPASLFLSISAKGCENERHILDDTGKVQADWRQVAFPFITYTEPQPRVFVCVKEEGSPGYVAVPRRIPLAERNGSVENSFAVAPNMHGVNPKLGRDREGARPPPWLHPVLPASASKAHANTQRELGWIIAVTGATVLLAVTLYMRGRHLWGHFFGGSPRLSRGTTHPDEVQCPTIK